MIISFHDCEVVFFAYIIRFSKEENRFLHIITANVDIIFSYSSEQCNAFIKCSSLIFQNESNAKA